MNSELSITNNRNNLWEERNLTEPKKSCFNNNEIVQKDIINDTNNVSMRNQCKNTGKINEKNKYYVYELKHPDTNVTFYVGKGCGKRMYDHEMRVKANKLPNRTNRKLFDFIKSLVESNKNIIYTKVRENMSELDALKVESELIQFYGFELLCNSPHSLGMNPNFRMKTQHSTDSKQKIRTKMLDRYKNGWIAPMTGKKHTDDYKKKRQTEYTGKGNPNYNNHKLRGKNHPLYDHTLYNFYNMDSNLFEICTRYELKTKYNLDKDCITRLVSGVYKSHKGWKIKHLL